MLIAIALAAALASNEPPPVPSGDLVSLGRQQAQQRCGACHAVGAAGSSPLRAAAPLRRFAERSDRVGRALREGISPGHPKLPQTLWEARDYEAFMAYLRTLQPTKPHVSR